MYGRVPPEGMTRGTLSVVPGIDGQWLAAAGRLDPSTHAYAMYDLAFEPENARFVTLKEDGHSRAYLLIWQGSRGGPVVHWVGDGPGSERLADELPERPMIAVVPESVAPLVLARRAPAPSYSVLLMERRPEEGPVADEAASVRALSAEDAPALRRLSEEYPSFLTNQYRRMDLTRSRVWGCFEAGRLVGVARTPVVLPSVWVIGGIFTVPSARGRGVGRAVTAAVTRAALHTRARAALFVREDNAPARRVYDRLGFHTVGRRVWVDAGVGSEP